MKASIIISLYNKRPYITDAIASCLKQDGVPGEFEIFICDDGSTDNGFSIAEFYAHFASPHVSVRAVTQKNAGVSAARNRGLAETTGEFVVFLDADDWIDPYFLAKTLPKMEDLRVGIVATDMQYEGTLSSIRIPPKGLTLEREIESNELPCCSLVRRSAIEVGYRKEAEPYEDWCFWLDIMKRGWQVAVVPEPLFHYRILSESAITRTHGHAQEYVKKIHKLHPDLWEKK